MTHRRQFTPLAWRFNDGFYFAHTTYGHFTLEQSHGKFCVKFNPVGSAGETNEQDMGTYKTLALAKASAARDHRALSKLG